MSRVEDGLLRIDRPFAIFVEESYDAPGVWIAHVVGHGLDNAVQGRSPEEAVFMAYDMLTLLTGRCSAEHPQHDLAVDTEIEVHDPDAEGEVSLLPAWGCSRCEYRTLKGNVREGIG